LLPDSLPSSWRGGNFAIYWLSGGRDETHEYVVVTKQNVGGLNPQAQVRYRGICVGKVSEST
jgi:phospholipid/cholesterol/gamma-HCH transport system substrate-binding protein